MGCSVGEFVTKKEKAAQLKHERIHTGKRPYPCRFCNKKFTQKSTMDSHTNTVHKGTTQKWLTMTASSPPKYNRKFTMSRQFYKKQCSQSEVEPAAYSQHKNLHKLTRKTQWNTPLLHSPRVACLQMLYHATDVPRLCSVMIIVERPPIFTINMNAAEC